MNTTTNIPTTLSQRPAAAVAAVAVDAVAVDAVAGRGAVVRAVLVFEHALLARRHAQRAPGRPDQILLRELLSLAARHGILELQCAHHGEHRAARPQPLVLRAQLEFAETRPQIHALQLRRSAEASSAPAIAELPQDAGYLDIPAFLRRQAD